MKVYVNPPKNTWEKICKRPELERANIQPLIEEIFSTVAQKGDDALRHYCKLFEASVPEKFKLSTQEIELLAREVPGNLKQAIMHAKNNIWQFHEAQRLAHQVIETDKEVRCWQRQVPLDSVAIYIPGGSAPLFSTVLMLGVPANAAGVREINLFTPSNKEGSIHPAIAYAAKLVGIKNIYRIGGAQAIAAAALGTEQIPKSFKIFGPGNQYVTAAKMHAQQLGVAIDMPAGPSEVLVWADTLANPAYIAADLLSQAEHGADSQCVLLCDDEDWVNLVEKELEKQLEKLPRKEIAKQALENSFAVVINEDYDEGNSRIAQCQFSNTYAPEHLIVNCSDYDELVPGIRNAGSVFLGPSSPESVGDYASGTNHTLPTAGHAKAYSGVSLSSFCKNITFQELSPLGLNNLAETVITMAEHEGLQAHANAVKIRLNNGN